MSLKLLFLGRLEDAAGGAERDVAPVATLDALLDSLAPELADILRGPRIRLALNGILIADLQGLTLADGDELAFLPPVSGG